MQANDVPPWTYVDPAIVRRTFCMEPDRMAVLEPTCDTEFKQIKDAELLVREEAFIAGMRAVIFRAYQRYQEEGHEPPPGVLHTTTERVEISNPCEALLSEYEIWSEEESASVPFASGQVAAAAKLGWSVRLSHFKETVERKHMGCSHTNALKAFKERYPIVRTGGAVRDRDGAVILGIRARHDFNAYRAQ